MWGKVGCYVILTSDRKAVTIRSVNLVIQAIMFLWWYYNAGRE